MLLICEENYIKLGDSADRYCFIDDHGNTYDEYSFKTQDELDYCMEDVLHIYECSVGVSCRVNDGDNRFFIIN